MRWDNLLDGSDHGTGEPAAHGRGPVTPALFGQGAVTRTFDTPGFRGMTFFEVHARSVINRVPDASRVPFRWTINPYRGCSHACVYCLLGETPILMADGRTKPLAELKVGDAVYGTVRRGAYRRYVITPVLAHWQTVKPAYLVALADGTHLVASGDHRFLSDHGWKHVAGAGQGTARRPYLTLADSLLGTGAVAQPPKQSAGYRRGYLCGLIRGTVSPGGRDGQAGGFPAWPATGEAPARARSYLEPEGLRPGCLTLQSIIRAGGAATAGSRICHDRPGIDDLIRWPSAPSGEWRKGFLAGVFDAAGSYHHGVLQIAADGEMCAWTVACLGSLRFRSAARDTRSARLTQVLIPGGPKEHLRFFHTTDPAVTRKRSIIGTAIKSDADLRVTRIEPLGVEMLMYDITTGTGDFIANGVVSHNCFARNTHTYLDLDAGQDFDTRIVVKVNAPERVRKELAAPRWRGEHIAMGTNVDCYQRAEGRYRLMPGILAALRDAANPFSILTKGTLILRDAPLLEEAAEVTEVGLAVSVGSTDGDLWRAVEPGTPSPLRRLEVCAAFSGSGLGCGVLMGPVVPFLSDSPGQLAATVRRIAAAGADYVSPIVLHLRPGAREWFLAWLREQHPGLFPRYQALYGRRAYAPRAYQEQIAAQVRELARQYGIGKGRPDRRLRARRAAAGSPGSGAPRPEPVQLSLL